MVDPALAVYLAGYHTEDALQSAREVGSFFETLVFLHLKVVSSVMVPPPRIFYWRTTTGKEVDFVLEHGKKLLALEVKRTSNPSLRDAEHLLSFAEEHPHVARGVLVHNGPLLGWLHSKVLAVPWWWLGG